MANKTRLNRSQLAVPGSRNDFFEKAANSKADAIFLDLEDSVALNAKKTARKNIIEAINDIDWKKKTLSVRVNEFESGFIEDDIEDILRLSSDRLDLIILPKVNKSSDLISVEKKILNCEKKFKRINKIGLEIIIETTIGLINIDSIAQSSSRNEAIHFGAADFAASIGAKTTNIGGVNDNYGVLENEKKNKRNFFINDMWHFALFKILLTAHAYGLRAIDCPYGDFNDELGFEKIAKSSYTMGFDGKMVIHPNQIELANKIYAPTEQEVLDSIEILREMELAKKRNKGAIAFKGKLLDIVSIKQAKNVVELANKIKEKG